MHRLQTACFALSGNKLPALQAPNVFHPVRRIEQSAAEKMPGASAEIVIGILSFFISAVFYLRHLMMVKKKRKLSPSEITGCIFVQMALVLYCIVY